MATLETSVDISKPGVMKSQMKAGLDATLAAMKKAIEG